MKVNKEAPYQLLFSIRNHPHLGPMVEPFVVELTSIHTLSLTFQKVFSGNAEYYDRLSQEELRLIALLDPVMVENLVKRFSPVPRIRPKDYFRNHFKRDDHKERIRPYIEQHLCTVLQEIERSGIPLYLADDINPAAERISFTEEPAKVLFHFRRNEQGTNYFATIKHGNQRIPFMKVGAVLLTSRPAYLVVHSKLYHFHPLVDGSRLGVFINRKFVHVRPESEHQYYSSFVRHLLERAPVFAQGFDVEVAHYDASPLLCMRQSEDRSYFVLQLNYGGMLFDYAADKHMHVHLEWRGNDPHFIKVRRSRSWEEERFQALRLLGLHSIGDLLQAGEGSLEEQIAWLRENRKLLETAGYELRFETEHRYSTEVPSLNYNLKEELDWFDLHVLVRIGEFSLPFRTFVQAIAKGERSHVLPNGEIFLIPEEWFALADRLGEGKFKGDRIRIAKFQLQALEGLNSERIKKHLLGVQQIQDEEVHPNFNGSLRAYQKQGLSWLMFLYRNRFGGILADDMGLGKTIQTLAYIQRIVHEEGVQGPVLLVAPTSLLYNWVDEATKFTPDLKVLIHSGMRRSKEASDLLDHDLVVTSYGLVRNDFDLLDQLDFHLIVLDESQHIKNMAAKATQLVGKLKSPHRLCLTGTPIENSISDLWSQMNFLNKGLLGTSKAFNERYIRPIEKDRDPQRIEELQNKIQPFVLRRTKQQVAQDLPSLTEKTIYCPMDTEQAKLYEEVKSAYRNDLLQMVDERGMEKSRLSILQGLSKLRQISNHPRLVDPASPIGSGKHAILLEHIRTVTGEGHRVLIFSQFVRYLRILASELKALDIEFLELSGQTPARERAERVGIFQGEHGPPVFLISLKAGGVGLNLTAADYVFIVDPWWNPAAEAQARDRTHRIGQDQKVISYKFISVDSVEEKILRLQSRKTTMASDLIQIEENFIKRLQSPELEALLS